MLSSLRALLLSPSLFRLDVVALTPQAFPSQSPHDRCDHSKAGLLCFGARLAGNSGAPPFCIAAFFVRRELADKLHWFDDIHLFLEEISGLASGLK